MPTKLLNVQSYGQPSDVDTEHSIMGYAERIGAHVEEGGGIGPPDCTECDDVVGEQSAHQGASGTDGYDE
eukprot:CAMPEP_0174305668 /NCGR_PEP_ID=MMETSP0809-20121228/61545_1 /TAXON_ID=73025 ORGANISM="Eutreptiella gymnastica-like, Strain CCMP1594" /NCGR_SAMPLE_ID=MMETSP0809 /ASSEMBLY_ACC=CAM_ASM_000658 /LENGTH=69 /DNA_ID=CAMNT_0015412181 /DNA_START=880 /DNA_END=1089 /DNA_ORIENTATION=-